MNDYKYDPERAKETLKKFSKPVLNYESPIELFYQDTLPKISESVDGYVLEACCNVGVDVNKEELVKALAYDRGQYEKGYKAGFVDGYKQAMLDITSKFTDKMQEIVEEVNKDVTT